MPPTVTLATTEIAGRLRLSATRLARRLRQESGSGLTPSLLSALAVVHNHGPMSIGAVADHERVAPPSMTKVIARLENDGLIERRADPGDKRVSLVSVTTTGRKLVAETRRRKNAWLATRIDTLDAEARARLEGALDVLDELYADEGS